MDTISYTLIALAALQAGLGFRVVLRLLSGRAARKIRENPSPLEQKVSIVVPVLNERNRIDACVRRCTKQSAEVVEILIVDGGSNDGTQNAVRALRRLDARLRLIDASPIPSTWTGKAWGLHVGLERSSAESGWILFLDADVGTEPNLTRSLVSHALQTGIHAFSVATAQRAADRIDAMLHPSMLATLIYRLGLPGRAASRASQVQANGQCFLSRRDLLMETGAILAARSSLCEDVTIARRIVEAGFAVGFYEIDNELVHTAMYADWRDTWNNWTRSLPMRDQYFGWRESVGLAEIAMLQALAIPLFATAVLYQAPVWLIAATGSWMLLRLGVLAGARRAYPERPWSYWISPLVDLPVAAKIIASAFRRRHSWRGRRYVRARGGGFYLTDEHEAK